MARMLQALKNLEAKSARPPAAKPVVKTAEAVAVETVAAPEPESRPLSAEHSPPVLSRSWSAEPPAASEEFARVEMAQWSSPALSTTFADPPAARRSEDIHTQEFGFAVSLSLPSIAGLSTPARSETTPTRPASTFERAIKRTLRDPVRSRPLEEMAERLRRDIEQNECKTLVFVGIGPASAVQETICYAATLLADREHDGVLLIDADSARQSLTAGLEYGDQRGLTELLASDDPPRGYCRLTATGRLLFLPAGLARHTDLSAAGPRLEQTLERLKAEFSCLLIDGGHTSDLSATALARQADATYLVVQLGAVETSEAQAALRDFRAAGARVIGCIAT